ncbi:hypothetical protein Q5H91_04815 [Sphingomonas sp. KR1UV-12]|uniref:Uncharacterized protein n=1 Tax=Sphingomonas aurea TaxID=3063994 RepID=A0ABT9EHT4_9SPHN|nr:hypothetical protein [Sphingomonas sp. KR1UV-12]MDP1026523.1 hypothetical protein [Sphingomonas sp. KR1UV-12]
MAAFAKALIDEALNDQQLTMSPGTNIGSIYLDSAIPGCNWTAHVSASDPEGIAEGRWAIAAVQQRYPNVSLTDMFCQYF